MRTNLREIRKARGVSAADLARSVGVSRQTIYSIEDGSFVPNTAISLQISRVLDVSVEELFSLADQAEPEAIKAELVGENAGTEGRLVRVCRLNHRLMAVPVSFTPAFLPRSDGIVESRTRRSVSIKSPADVPENGNRLLLAGCDPALSLLNDAVHLSGFEIISVPCSSRRALEWLKKGRVHAAGSHLLDRATGDYNLPNIRRLLPDNSVRVITFATWEQGLVVSRGNPKSIRAIADLAGKSVRIVNREKGSGSRDVLDIGLMKAGIRPKQVNGYTSIAQGHLAAAYEVASGNGDCCIAPRSAARCFGLDFVPLAWERFDLAITRDSLELPVAKALLDLLHRSRFRKKLECIAGYETKHTGEVLL